MKNRIQQCLVPLLALAAVFGAATQALAQPTSTASAPTAPQSHVISIFNSSNTYTNIAGVNPYENWGGWFSAGDYSIPPVVLSYLGLSYGGIGFEGNPQNVSDCTNLHVDLWTPNGNSFAVRLVDSSGHSADYTYTMDSGAISSGSWIGLNMLTSSFTNANPALNLHSIQQIGLIENNPGENPGGDFYLDNIYFVGGTNLTPLPPIPVPTNSAATPNRSSNSVLAMYDSSGVYPVHAPNTWNAGWSSAGEAPYTITNTTRVVLKYTALQFNGIEFYNPNQINVTNYNTMHIDLWTPNANQFGVQLVSLDNGGTQSAQVNFLPASGKIVSNQWVSLDIPLNQFTSGNASLNMADLQQMLWIDNQTGGGVSGGIFYIDNVYFYSNSVAPPPIPTPTNNAATPSQPSSGVLAMYNSSGVYPNSPGINWHASWSGASESSFTITNTGRVVLQYGSLSFNGVEFYNPNQVNASAYNTMHVDVWTPNANQFGIQLVSLDNGGTQAAQVDYLPASGKIVSNQWVSLDIPLSQFQAVNTNLDLGDLQQLLWIDNQAGGGVTSGIFYVDNVYFYNSVSAVAQRLTASVKNGTIKLSFPTQSGFSYTVQYKNSLTDTTWQTLSTVAGSGATQTVTDPTNQTKRFYRLSVH